MRQSRAIHRLLERLGLTAMDVDYICAHATSSPASDRKETLVIKRVGFEPFGHLGDFGVGQSGISLAHIQQFVSIAHGKRIVELHVRQGVLQNSHCATVWIDYQGMFERCPLTAASSQ
jgi:hypothetical protein